jgi:hypothetical protein
MRRILAATLAATAVIAAQSGTAQARITRLELLGQEPFAAGARFGAAGPYVRIRAIAHGELDPAAPANAAIDDLARAPRNARGMVEYDTDVFILRPADVAKGSGVLLYDVTNRGNKFLMSWVNDAPEPGGNAVNDPRSMEDAGNGFSFRRGWTMVWSGWQPEIPRGGNLLGIHVPVATDNGAPIVRRIRDEIIAGTRGPERVAIAALPYQAANPDPHAARLTVRARETDPRVDIPADQWEFAGPGAIRLLPAGTEFAPRKIYDLFYDAKDPVVGGIGFAATRDVVAFLRHARADDAGTANPVLAADGTGLTHTLAFGVSLSGRYLHHFLSLGMNRDEQGGRVFDGMLPHISGAGKVFDNTEFSMPGRTATQHEDHSYPENWFPYTYATLPNPAGGAPASLLRGDGSDPLVIETNTTTEYWQKAASLLSVDPRTGQDVPLPDSVRLFLIAGTQHGGHFGATATAGYCANIRNPHSAGPALRAMLADLEEWVAHGTKPPASRVPSVADGTAITAGPEVFPAIPGIIWPSGANTSGPPVDWANPPRANPVTWPTLISKLDADGNEIAGLRLPDIAVPTATYTGTNVYKDMPAELCDRDGTYAPLARTEAERQAVHDPRPSLGERYGTHETYVAKLRAAADALVAARLLLAEDADRYVAAAQAASGF